MASNKEVYYAKVSQGSQMKISKVVGWKGQKQMNLSIGFLDKMEAIIGLQDGQLAIIQGGSVFKQIPAHKRSVFAIANSNDL